MIRVALLIALVACSDKQADKQAGSVAAATKQLHSGTPAEVHASCEAARDKYFAWRTSLLDRVHDNPEMVSGRRQELEAEKPTFVDACAKLGLLIDVSCFDREDIGQIADPVKKQRCTTTANELAVGLSREAAAPAEVHDASCEALRDTYLAWSADRVKGALGGNVAGAHTAELQAEADKEMAIAKTKFVGACVAMGSALDGSCFEIEHGMSRDRNKHTRCMKIVNELEAKMFAK